MRCFALLMLEGQQAGLSWITVLNKRAYMDEVFAGFDPRILGEHDTGGDRAVGAGRRIDPARGKTRGVTGG